MFHRYVNVYQRVMVMSHGDFMVISWCLWNTSPWDHGDKLMGKIWNDLWRRRRGLPEALKSWNAIGKWCFFMRIYGIYPLVMTNLAIELALKMAI